MDTTPTRDASPDRQPRQAGVDADTLTEVRDGLQALTPVTLYVIELGHPWAGDVAGCLMTWQGERLFTHVSSTADHLRRDLTERFDRGFKLTQRFGAYTVVYVALTDPIPEELRGHIIVSENTDLTTTVGAMAPDDVPHELAEIAARTRYDHYRLPSMAPWEELTHDYRERSIDAQRPMLAAVLPLYGAAIIANAGVEHYDRQVRLADSLTTRVARAGMLLSLAEEAQAVANQGIEPTLNTELARMLRDRAHREGKS